MCYNVVWVEVRNICNVLCKENIFYVAKALNLVT